MTPLRFAVGDGAVQKHRGRGFVFWCRLPVLKLVDQFCQRPVAINMLLMKLIKDVAE